MKKYIYIFLIILFLAILWYINYSKINELEEKTENEDIGENTIWSYWDQGVENISLFSKKCVQTWIRKNPNHRVIILDKFNVYNYLDKKELPSNWEYIDKPQHKSDFLRLALLVKYGGVWIDISTICIKPINSIFKQKKSIEGFAIREFSKNNDLSILENWFLTGKKGSKILKIWRDELFNAFGNATSMNSMDKSYFKNIDFENIGDDWYLTMHKVFVKCNKTNPEFAYLYKNDSQIYGSEETVNIYHTYFQPDLYRMVREDNKNFMIELNYVNTPILKFSNGIFHHLEEHSLNSQNTVMYKLLN
jgi:hypothetical protein